MIREAQWRPGWTSKVRSTVTAGTAAPRVPCATIRIVHHNATMARLGGGGDNPRFTQWVGTENWSLVLREDERPVC